MTTVIEGASSGTARRRAAWRVRPVRPEDKAALEALFARLSEQTVRLRFFGRFRAFPAEYLEAVLACRPEAHDAVVAYAQEYGEGGREADAEGREDGDGGGGGGTYTDMSAGPGQGPGGPALIGLASLAAVPVTREVPGEEAARGEGLALAGRSQDRGRGRCRGQDQGGDRGTGPSGGGPSGGPSNGPHIRLDIAELGIVVADPWQRQGVGTAMAAALLARARTRGVVRVVATVLPGRSALLAATARHLPLVPVAHARDPYGLTAVYKLDRGPAAAGTEGEGPR